MKFDRIASSSKSIPDKPFIGILSVSQRCNSFCTYCDSWQDSKPDPLLKQSIQAINQFCKLGISLVGLTGGEPLLNLDLEDIISHAKNRGLFVTVTTNGTLVTPERVSSLERAGCDAIMFSLDTLQPGQYEKFRGIAIDGVLAGINAALKTGSRMRLGVNSVVTHSNLVDLPEIGRFCLERQMLFGITPLHQSEGGFSFPTFTEGSEEKLVLRSVFKSLTDLYRDGLLLGNSLSYLVSLEDFLTRGTFPRGFNCSGADRCISVSTEGHIHICPVCPPIGNISELDLFSFWGSPDHQLLREFMHSGTCVGCWRSYRADTYSLEWLRSWFGIHPEQ